MPGAGIKDANSSATSGFSGTLDAVQSSTTGTPLTHFTTNSTGGFDAFIFPELLNGTPSLQGGIFTLPSTVNAGYVVILDPGGSQNNTSTWGDVIQFIDNGNGHATTLQMLVGGPNQATYFPSLNKVDNASHVFITETQGAEFTDYSVTSGREVRNYHFFNGTLSVNVPDGGSTLMFLGSTVVALLVFRRKLVLA